MAVDRQKRKEASKPTMASGVCRRVGAEVWRRGGIPPEASPQWGNR